MINFTAHFMNEKDDLSDCLIEFGVEEDILLL